MSTSNDIIKNYKVDLSALDKEVQKLKNDNEQLRKSQAQINKAYEKGSIDLNTYKKQSAQVDKSLSQNKESIQSLAKSLRGLGAGFGNVAEVVSNLFLGPAGIAAIAGTAITSIIDKIRQAREEEAEERQRARDKQKKELQRDIDYEIKLRQAQGKTEVEAIQSVINDIEEKRKAHLKKVQENNASFYGFNNKKQMDLAEMNAFAFYDELEDLNKRLLDAREAQTIQNEQDMRALADESHKAKLKQIEDEKKARQQLIEQEAIQREFIDNKISELHIQLIDNEHDRNVAKIKHDAKIAINEFKKALASTDNEGLKSGYSALIDLTEQLTTKRISALDKTLTGTKEYNDLLLQTEEKVKSVAAAIDSMEKFPNRDNIVKLQELRGQIDEYTAAVKRLSVAESDRVRKRNEELKDLEEDAVGLQEKLNEERARIEDAILMERQRISGQMSQMGEGGGSVDRSEYDRLLKIQEDLNKRQLELDQNYQLSRKAIIADADTDIEILYREHNQKMVQMQKEMMLQTVSSWTEGVEGISAMLSALADTQDENTKKYLGLQRASILVNMAATMAKGASAAAEAGWPALLMTIPTTLAAIVAQFAQIRSLEKQAKFADGGLVTGPGSGRSDSISAKLSNGESVMNADATRMYAPILSSLNTSTGGRAIYTVEQNDRFEQILTRALEKMPSPIVSVESIERQEKIMTQVDVLSHIM